MEYEQIIEAIAARLRGLSQREFRVHRLCRDLIRFSDADIAYILQALYRGSLKKQRSCLFIVEALADFSELRGMLGARLAEIYREAEAGRLYLAAEWLVPLPLHATEPRGLETHEDLQSLTLGERKWMARKAEPAMLEKLLVDPNPTVIRNLLNHPRLEERHVVRICAKQPNHPGVMIEVYRHRHWFSRLPVKKALLNNPASPSWLVMLIIPWLPVQDLRALLKSARFSQGFINQILAERRRDETDDAEEAWPAWALESEQDATDRLPSAAPIPSDLTAFSDLSEDEDGGELH
ncbi:MAG: hypothetical protein C4523_09105 [Myxococcales bacterium]|nr:MAG: hypothetical protein C4523_09105 [Myxococcales bacterium]